MKERFGIAERLGAPDGFLLVIAQFRPEQRRLLGRRGEGLLHALPAGRPRLIGLDVHALQNLVQAAGRDGVNFERPALIPRHEPEA